MTYAEARAVAAANPKFRAAVETAPSLPLRDSEEMDVQVFRLVREAEALFKELYESHEEDGWTIVVGSKTRGFAVFERGDEVFVLNLDKRIPQKRDGHSGDQRSE